MLVTGNFASNETLRVFSQMKDVRIHLGNIIWKPLVCSKENDYSNLEQTLGVCVLFE